MAGTRHRRRRVATQTIKRRRKLVGIDVIYVHRLLKNPVQVPEYVLDSEERYRGGRTAPSVPAMQELTQELDGIGLVRTYDMDVGGFAAPLAPLSDPSWPRRIGDTLGMVGRGLPYIVRRRRAMASAG